MSAFHERQTRSFQTIQDSEKIKDMLQKYVVGKDFYLKGLTAPTPVRVEKLDSNNQLIVTTEAIPDEIPIIYKIYKKYMEIVCTLVDDLTSGRYRLQANLVQIAIEERKHPRAIIEEGVAVINNIRAARNVINASLFNIPTSVKVHFSQFQHQMEKEADEVKVQVFDQKDEKLELVRKSGKMLFIENTQEQSAYSHPEENLFVDYKAHLSTDIVKIMDHYRNRKIVSELIVPITYIGHDGVPVQLGYIQLLSKSTPFTADKAIDIKSMAFEMVDRIRDSNTMLINKRQHISNISRGGMRLKIDDQELKKFLIHQKGFSFDIVFKLQQPITVFTEITYTGLDLEKNILIGVQIKGWSSRRGEMDRYFEMVDKLTETN